MKNEYRIVQPMKYATAKSKDILEAALNSPDYCLQLKKDGASYVLAKDLDGSVHLYGDRISKKTGKIIDKIANVPHIADWADDHFPRGSQLIVEICYGKTSKDVNSIMLALPEKAIRRQDDTTLATAYVFDILFWDEYPIYNLDYQERYNEILEIFHHRNHPDFITYAEAIFDNKADKLSEWIAAGEEGGVLKRLTSSGKISAKHAIRDIGQTAARPMHTTYKVKQIDTVDVVITGIEMPTKEYTGKDPDNWPYKDEDGNPVNRLWYLGIANAFSIGAFGEGGNLFKIGTVASGLDDELRKAAVDNPDSFIGHTIEVHCMSKDNNAKTLRHPRFVRMRPDKAATSCLMDEIFN